MSEEGEVVPFGSLRRCSSARIVRGLPLRVFLCESAAVKSFAILTDARIFGLCCDLLPGIDWPAQATESKRSVGRLETQLKQLARKLENTSAGGEDMVARARVSQSPPQVDCVRVVNMVGDKCEHHQRQPTWHILILMVHGSRHASDC
jgi:hypothetical protein